ncbi:hypothetical protein DENSPDRAFT_844366 [Dentipellis sp. KUC8613]|nr:hypothetical protein DENSPDRAFT_844366 [Dentipellis sp. KUC8613]
MSMNDGMPVLVPGNHEPGPPMPDYYKRAVYRAAPPEFEVEVLAPTKIGGAFCYGMRILPIRSSAASMRSRASTALTDYVIWRRWEDCLWFQDVLEQEYSIKSREKRQRLHAGKGVKKNGIYIHDRAASFESLPPGPDPKSVAKDVHDFLPKLSKKGTLFRPSQGTIGQRHREFANLIHYLFKEEVPALIRELREERVVRDFFGHWRRDHDIARKSKGKISTISTNTFSTYFSASNISLSLPDYPDVPSSPRLPSNRSSLSSTTTPQAGDSNESNSSLSLSDVDIAMHQPRSPPASAPARAPGFHSRDEHAHHVANKASGSSLGVPRSPGAPSTSSTSSRPSKPRSPRDKPSFDMEEDFPLFLSSATREGLPPTVRPPPTRPNPPVGAGVGVGGLESLPEDHELGVPPPQDRRLAPPAAGRSRSNSAAEPPSRAASMYVDTPDLERARTAADAPRPASIALSTISFQLGAPPSRISWRSSRSSESSYGELDLPFTPTSAGADELWFLAHDPAQGRPDSFALDDLLQPPVLAKPARRSMSPPPLSPSSGTGVGAGAGNGVGAEVRRSLSAGSRRPRSQSQPMPADPEEGQFYASRPETPDQAAPQPRRRQLSMTDSLRAFHLPSSPLTSPSAPQADGDAGAPALVIKAAFNDAIVVFRVPRGAALADVRARLYDRLVREEGLMLGREFRVAFVPPAGGTGRPRAGSVGTMVTVSSVATVGAGREVRTEAEWEEAVGSVGVGAKVVLRIFEGGESS